MKFKKLAILFIVGVMSFSIVACSGKDDESASTDNSKKGKKETSSEKLVVWTLADDLSQFADRYMEENKNVKIETVIIAPADYPTKLQSALLGKATEPDIIVGEPQMLEKMYEAGFFEDLNKAPYNAQDYADKIVDYVWEVGQDSDGIQRAISYQITPAGIYYRRDIALKVFGTDDPTEIEKLFADYDTIFKTGETLKDAGYKIFASDGEMGVFSGDTAWVVDGTLNVDQARFDYMDLCISLYQNDLTAFATQWSSPWYQAMAGEIPILTADTDVWDEDAIKEASKDAQMTEVFAFGLPSWGVLTMRDNYGDTSGLWGVCSGPSSGFGGGTYIGISAQSKRKELSWDFLKFCTLNEETMEWWIVQSEGDTVSYIPSLEAHAEDENEVYGGQKLNKFWLEQAKDIDFSRITQYDTIIGDAWNAAITAVKTGEKSKEDAITAFYDVVKSTYQEIKINK